MDTREQDRSICQTTVMAKYVLRLRIFLTHGRPRGDRSTKNSSIPLLYAVLSSVGCATGLTTRLTFLRQISLHHSPCYRSHHAHLSRRLPFSILKDRGALKTLKLAPSKPSKPRYLLHPQIAKLFVSETQHKVLLAPQTFSRDSKPSNSTSLPSLYLPL